MTKQAIRTMSAVACLLFFPKEIFEKAESISKKQYPYERKWEKIWCSGRDLDPGGRLSSSRFERPASAVLTLILSAVVW